MTCHTHQSVCQSKVSETMRSCALPEGPAATLPPASVCIYRWASTQTSLQVPCCNIHFINEGVFQINTSQCGLTGFKQDYCPETLDRKLSLCAWTLLPESPEVLIVPDALQDVRSALTLSLLLTCPGALPLTPLAVAVCTFGNKSCTSNTL